MKILIYIPYKMLRENLDKECSIYKRMTESFKILIHKKFTEKTNIKTNCKKLWLILHTNLVIVIIIFFWVIIGVALMLQIKGNQIDN